MRCVHLLSSESSTLHFGWERRRGSGPLATPRVESQYITFWVGETPRERATGYSPCGIPPRGDGGGGKGDEVREVFLTKVLGGTPSGDKVVDDEVREVLLTKVLGANGNEDDEVREVLHTKVLGGPGGGKVDESTTAAA